MLITSHPRFWDKKNFCSPISFFNKSQIKSAKLTNQTQINFLKSKSEKIDLFQIFEPENIQVVDLCHISDNIWVNLFHHSMYISSSSKHGRVLICCKSNPSLSQDAMSKSMHQ